MSQSTRHLARQGLPEFPDLAFMNALIPPEVDLDVKAGRAVVDDTFRTGGADASIWRGVTVTTTGLVLEAGGVELAGDVKLAIQVPDVTDQPEAE